MPTGKMTIVKILKDVPLSRDNSRQITFSDASAQFDYFNSKSITENINCSYQREQLYFRYAGSYDEIKYCNYIMYQNSDHTLVWFYAYITAIEYKNENDSFVYFQIDPYQTYMFDIEIKQCFVEREHVTNDAIGANLIDEGLACGDYVTNASRFISFNQWSVIVATTVDLNSPFDPVVGKANTHLFSGCAYYGFTTQGDLMALMIVLERIADAGKLDGIVQIFMYPTQFIRGGPPHFERVDDTQGASTLTAEIPRTNSLNGYTPRNNKLFTAPYKSGVMSVTTGGAIQLPYEYFSGNSYQISYGSMISPNTGIMAWVKNFKGIVNNYDYKLSLSDFPTCSWLGNTYANWNATQSIRSTYRLNDATVNHALNTASGAVNQLAAGNIGGAALGGINSVVSYAQDVYGIASQLQQEREVHSLVPYTLNGQTACSPLVANDAYGIMLEDRSITADWAKSIDDFLWVYGYKVNKVKVPNITGRKYWNFVKTSNAIVVGGAPAPYLEEIQTMLNRGVTFWHNPDNVGNYSLDNSTGQGPGPIPTPDDYLLLVNLGYGSGTYEAGEKVTIEASLEVNFKTWVSNAGGTFDDPTSPRTVFTMPAANVTVTPTYSDIPPDPGTTFTLMVNNGEGSGNYTGGSYVSIRAFVTENFDRWVSSNGGIFQAANMPSTVFTMPFNNVAVTPVYTNPPEPTGGLADYAEQFIGSVEWDANVGLWQNWYYGRYVKDAWCTTFATYCAFMLGLSAQVPRNEGVQRLYEDMTKLGTTWSATSGKLPKRNDICFFITSQSSTTLHHCGIVTNMHSDGKTFDYVSGNTGNPNGGPDGVFIKTTTIGKTTPSYVKYFGEVT